MADLDELNRRKIALIDEIDDLTTARYNLASNAGVFIQEFNSLKTVFSSILSTLSETEDTVFNQAISGIISNANDSVIDSSIAEVKKKVSQTLDNIDSAIDSKKRTLEGIKAQIAAEGGLG